MTGMAARAEQWKVSSSTTSTKQGAKWQWGKAVGSQNLPQWHSSARHALSIASTVRVSLTRDQVFKSVGWRHLIQTTPPRPLELWRHLRVPQMFKISLQNWTECFLGWVSALFSFVFPYNACALCFWIRNLFYVQFCIAYTWEVHNFLTWLYTTPEVRGFFAYKLSVSFNIKWLEIFKRLKKKIQNDMRSQSSDLRGSDLFRQEAPAAPQKHLSGSWPRFKVFKIVWELQTPIEWVLIKSTFCPSFPKILSYSCHLYSLSISWALFKIPLSILSVTWVCLV